MSENKQTEGRTAKGAAPRRGLPAEYIVVNNAFFDGVQLHQPGERIVWAGPPSQSLHPAEAPKPRTATEAPLFPDPLKGRGDGMAVEDARPVPRPPAADAS